MTEVTFSKALNVKMATREGTLEDQGASSQMNLPISALEQKNVIETTSRTTTLPRNY